MRYLPHLIHEILARYHQAKIRAQLARPMCPALEQVGADNDAGAQLAREFEGARQTANPVLEYACDC